MMFNEPEYLPDSWLIELGRISQSWAAFEQIFNLMLQKLAGFDDMFDPTFTILVAHSSMPQRLDIFASLCDSHASSAPHLCGYREVLRQIREAQASRNRFAHSIISVDKENAERGRLAVISARGKLKQEFVEITLNDLKTASEKVLMAARSVYKLVLQLN